MSNGHNSAATVCADLVASFQYGQIVLKDWFYSRFGYDPASDSNSALQAYMRAMERVHDSLRTDYKMVLMNVEGGYRIALPDECPQIAIRRTQAAITAAFAEGESVLSATAIHLLSDEKRREHTDAQVHLARLRDMLKLKK